MAERIIGLISCILCAIPFLIISVYGKDSKTPINFWSGDTSLKKKIHNITAYNKEIADLYKKCAFAFVVAGLGCLLYPLSGIILIILECTTGIYVVYKEYKKILKKYS